MARKRAARIVSLKKVHREIDRLTNRLKKGAQTRAARKLLGDLRTARQVLDCDATMLVDLTEAVRSR